MNKRKRAATNSKQWIVEPAADGRTLVTVLARYLHISRRRAKALLDRRTVFVNEKRIWMARHTVQTGDRLEVRDMPSPPGTASGDIPILFRDRYFLVVDKPPFMLSNGSPDSSESRLRRQLNNPALEAVHRLDRETGGCLLFAMEKKALQAMIEVFKTHRITKIYRMLAFGRMQKKHMRIHKSLDNRSAVSRIRLLENFPAACYLEVTIHTGRTHQIRRHLASIGHPVIGDKKYVTGTVREAALRNIQRHMLHAWRLAFTCPLTGKKIDVRAPMPNDFTACWKMLNTPERC
jgi:23S rRNA pseudouridine1911/1915/1917 synthase